MARYIPIDAPGVANIRRDILHRVDVDTEDMSMLDQDAETMLADPPGEIDQDELLKNESMSYDPDFSDRSSVISAKNHDTTELSKVPRVDLMSLLNPEKPDPDQVMDTDVKDEAEEIPKEVVDYFNEAAMKAAERNALPDSEFGIPRLRAYPLHDKKHVLQAIRMFGHCKNEEDKKTLASRIVKKVKQFDMDVTFGKDSALYSYLPKSLQEAVTDPDADDGPPIIGLADLIKHPGKRTKKEILMDHLQHNAAFYNNVFYGIDYRKSAAVLPELSFLEYFYPNFRTHSFYHRLQYVIGGIGSNREAYEILGLQYPFTADRKPLESVHPVTEKQLEGLESLLFNEYDPDRNWFDRKQKPDVTHIVYCLTLYSIMGEIMCDPHFTMNQLDQSHLAVLLDWGMLVRNTYDALQDTELYSAEYFKYAQILFDLYWNCLETPSEETALENINALIVSMSADYARSGMINEDNELFTPKTCTAYLVQELGMTDDMFLVPELYLYPIINKSSIKYAMDAIESVEKDMREEYSKNLNRKYKEFGCTFTISVDHPYAPYADKEIIDRMVRILTEGSTMVDDLGTSSGETPPEDAGQWWHRNVHMTGTITTNILDNKEIKPNAGKIDTNVDYVREDSII